MIATRFAPLALALLPCLPTAAHAHHGRHRCGHQVEVVWEERVVQQIVCQPVVRQRTVTVMKSIPETKMVTRQFRKMVPQEQTRTVPYVVPKAVWTEVQQQVTVMKPHVETRTGTRTVCRRVPVQTTRTVCVDEGHWETHPPSCGCCHSRRVWVSNVVTKQVPCTVWKTEQFQQPYEYQHCEYRPEVRTRTIPVCNYEYENKTREVTCTVWVPQIVEKTVPVTTFRCVPEQKVIDCTVLERQVVERIVKVPVCRVCK